ncbi:hypothetical protein [Iodobacter fluviatilis]|uniref:Uncharacterized protein n=1 Tax=Iodobacter fluviatilis TaxID=537 RepID=A0A7G3GEU2_9NEIS|nr:hypothetical protein [Iodobacter fluviatilis]QBC45921.1 hypothetical protein C1H71_20495 [Iodobacter fluviatilis]
MLGLGIQGEVALDHLRLVSLGAQLSRDDQNESVQIIFCDPDTLALMVIEHEWPHSEPSTPILQRRLLSQPLHKIMQSQIVTQAAKRHANGTLSIANTARHSNILPMMHDAWQQIAHPLRHPNAQSLQRWLQQADPAFAQPQQVVSQLYLLPVTEILAWGWDASSQTLRASLQCGEDEQLDQVELSLHYSACAPQAIDILAKILHDDALSMISGWAHRHGERLYFEPIAVCDKDRVIMLQAQQTAQSIEMPSWQEHATLAPLHDLLQQSRALLAQWLLQGLIHLGSNIAQKVQYRAQQLRQHGLGECAERLQRALNSLQSSAPEQMPHYLTELYYLIFEYEKEQSTVKDVIILPD